MNDTLRLAMEQAAEDFEHNGQIFNAAGLSDAIVKMAGLTCSAGIDGRIIRVIVSGRRDVVLLKGGSHYRLREVSP